MQDFVLDRKKIYSYIIIFLVLSALVLFIIFQRNEISSLRYSNRSLLSQAEIAEGIVRARSSMAREEDIIRQIHESGIDIDKIIEDMRRLGHKIDGYYDLSTISTGSKDYSIPSSKTVEYSDGIPDTISNKCAEEIKKIDSISKKNYLTIYETFPSTKVPFAEVGYSPLDKDPWNTDIYKREYKLKSVFGVDEEGNRTSAYSSMIISVGEKEYTVGITNADYTYIYPESKFRFSPRIYGGISSGVSLDLAGQKGAGLDFSPNLSVSLFSYGKTKTDIEWSLASIGIGYSISSETMNLSLSPFSYNVGKQLPLVDNIFIGPSFSIDYHRNLSIMLGINFGL